MTFFTLIIKNLLRRKVRTCLTCIGIAIAIGAMVTLVGISNGFESSTVESFSEHGVDIVVVEADKPDQLSSDLDQNLTAEIEKLPGVAAVAPGLVVLVSMYTPSGNTIPGVLVIGWQPGSFQFKNLALLDGRFPESGESKALALGATIAGNLNKKVGDMVELRDEAFQVVGIYKSATVFENGAIIMPLSELQRIEFRPDSVSGFEVVVEEDSSMSVEAICTQIERLKSEQRNVRHTALPTREYVQASMHIRLAHAMAWLTSVIATVMGTISTLNTMTMSVFERFREIGILRAIGWGKWRITSMVLGESVVLSVAGAFIGVLSAVVVLRYLSQVPLTSGFIDGHLGLLVIGQGFAVAIIVGLIGGILPAYRASCLLPTEALRHE